MRRVLLITAPLVLAVSSPFARTWHINPDGSGDAPTIQAGIDSAVAGDSVLLACGTYGEFGIRMKSGICLSGEVGEAGCATIDAGGRGRVLICELVDNSASIVGLTLRGGRASGSFPDHLGGGLYCESSSPEVRNCTFVGNHATWGGGGLGILNWCTPDVTECVFQSNTADAHGAGVFYHASAPRFRGCSIVDNVAFGWGGGVLGGTGSFGSFQDCVISRNRAYDGGGAYCNEAETGFTDCVFEENTAVDNGGGVFFQLTEGPRARLEACTIVENQARTSGGVHCGRSSPVIEGCSILRNQALDQGGGILLWVDSSPQIIGCLIAENNASKGGGIYLENECMAGIRGCTLFGNVASQGGSGLYSRDWSLPDVQNTIIAFGMRSQAIVCEAGGGPTMVCTDIYGNQYGDWTSCAASQNGVDGNFSADPLFCGASAGDFTLASASPCLPGQHPNGFNCDLLGPFGEGCSGPTAVEHTSWGGVKSLFR